MAINKFMRLALKVLSYPDIDIRKTYQIERSIRCPKLPALLPKDRWSDHTIAAEGRDLNADFTRLKSIPEKHPAVFHGGGWVTEVLTLIIRFVTLWPKPPPKPGCFRGIPAGAGAPFPQGLDDCYAAARGAFCQAKKLWV